MNNEELSRRMAELEAKMRALESAAAIPKEVDGAFRARFSIDKLAMLQAQAAKTAGSETQAVNEAGAASYSVAKPMDGFKAYFDRETGAVIYIPYYN